MCVCVFFPFILDIKFVGRTSQGHTGGRSHRIFHPPSFCGACLYFSREKDSAVPFPRRPRSRTLCTSDLIVLHLLGIFFLLFIFFSEEKSQLPGFELTSQRVRRLRGCQLSYRGDRLYSMVTSNFHKTHLRVCVCFLPIHSGHQVRWTYQPGSHWRKLTQDFSSTFLLRCVP